MTKKDYERIARAIAGTSHPYGRDGEYVLYLLARRLADTLEDDNPRFDRQKFLKACNVIA